jgi:hypothetical protein
VRRLALALCTAALAASGSSAQALTVGIGDQQPATFSDPAYYALGATITRYITPWDAVTTDPAKLDAWMRPARASGAEVMVAFNRSAGSRCPSTPCVLPTVDQYKAAVAKFLAKYPWVTTITPWNEVNDQGQPTNANPTRAAGYHQAVTQLCPACRVLGADVIDNGTQVSWLTTFLRALPAVPRLWGLHNYVDGNYFRSTGTESVLKLLPGEIWLTETGGLVQYTGSSGATAFPFDEARAARAEQFLLAIADANPDRITRYYHYEWKSLGPKARWDSALVRADGTPRPALDLLRPRMPGRPKSSPAVVVSAGDAADPPAPGGARGPAPPPAARAVIVTRGRSRRPLKLRVACLAPRGKRCKGSVRVARMGTKRFSMRSGKSASLVLRKGRAAKRPKITVALTAPAKGRWTEVPAISVPHRG